MDDRNNKANKRISWAIPNKIDSTAGRDERPLIIELAKTTTQDRKYSSCSNCNWNGDSSNLRYLIHINI